MLQRGSVKEKIREVLSFLQQTREGTSTSGDLRYPTISLLKDLSKIVIDCFAGGRPQRAFQETKKFAVVLDYGKFRTISDQQASHSVEYQSVPKFLATWSRSRSTAQPKAALTACLSAVFCRKSVKSTSTTKTSGFCSRTQRPRTT